MTKNIKNIARASRMKAREHKIPAKDEIGSLYAGDLKDNQSVRTSFRLSREGSEALIWLAQDANVKFQGVLTHIAGALFISKTMRDAKKSPESEQDSLLNKVVEAARNLDPKSRDSSARKTYAVNKQVLRIFSSIAKSSDMPRDLLVDLALKIKKAERQAKIDTLKKRYEEAMQEIDALWGQAEALEKRLRKLLDEDDPILNRFSMSIVVLMNLSLAIESSLKTGAPIDRDDISQSC